MTGAAIYCGLKFASYDASKETLTDAKWVHQRVNFVAL